MIAPPAIPIPIIHQDRAILVCPGGWPLSIPVRMVASLRDPASRLRERGCGGTYASPVPVGSAGEGGAG
jgi:hypothetical protein